MKPRTHLGDAPDEVRALRERLAALEAAEAERARAQQVQEALYRIADAASAVQDMAEFYPAIHRIVGELMFAENFYIALYDEERQAVNYPYMVDQVDAEVPDPKAWDRIGTGQARGGTAYVLRTGRPALLTHERQEELLASGEIVLLGVAAEDWLGVPLVTEGRTVGALVVQSYDTVHRYTQADVDLLAFVGQHVATALSRVRAVEETRQRNAELAIINEIGSALARELDMSAMYELVGERIRELFRASSMFIATYNRSSNLISFPYEIDNGQRINSEPFEFGPGLSSIVIRSGQPLRFGTQADMLEQGAIMAGALSSSWLGVPMVGADGVSGVITLESYEPNAFSEADERLLGTLASNLGVALEGARLLDQTRQRNAELAVINSVQAGLAAQLDMQGMYDLVGDKIQEIFDAPVVDIAIVDREAGAFRFPYTIERGVRFAEEALPIEHPGSPAGIRRLVMASREAVLIRSFSSDVMSKYGEPGIMSGEAPKSVLFVPLVVAGEATGVVSLQNLDREDAFSDADVRLLTTIAASLSVALENARLVDETRQRASELAIINEIGTALAGELEMQAMYELVGDQVRGLLRASSMFIAAYDRETNLIRFPYEIENGERYHSGPIEFGAGLTSIVIRTGKPLRGGSTAELARLGALLVDAVSGPDGPQTASWLGVPMVGADGVTGVIAIESFEANAFSDADQRLLATLAANLGVALEGAKLLDQTRQRNAELAVVNSVQAGLAAELEMQAMYEMVGDKIAEIFDTHVVDIATWDRETDLLRFPYGIERGVRLYDEPLPVFGFRRHVLATGQPLLIDDLERQAADYGNPLAPMSGESAKSLVFAPLLSGGQPFGVVSLQNLERVGAFSQGDMELLATLTASLSVALENARLIDETRQRAAELEIVNSVGQALSAHLDLDSLIAQLGDQMVKTFAADIAYVALHDRDTNLIEFPYYSEGGVRAAEPPLHFGEGLTSRILRSREPLLLNQDAQFEALGTRGVGTRVSSYLGVPILVAGTAIGVISVQSSHEVGRFGESDTRLLTTLAANVGIAIQNARLYRAQQEGERQYRQLVEELPLVVYTDQPDATRTATYISPQVEAMFGYPRSSWFEKAFFASILHPDDRERLAGQSQLDLDDPDARESDLYRVIAADDRVVWVRDDAWIVRDEHGTPLHLQGFMMDVTEQTLAAAEIRRQKQYFEALVDISPVAVVTMDRGELVSGWNPAATRLFGYEPDEAIGRHVDDLLFTPDGREEGRTAARLATEAGRAQLIGRRHRKDGEPVDVEIVVVPLVIDGEHMGYYAIYHDITELQAARAAAEDANQAKSTFLAAMSHEIRTPMNAIIGMSGLLLDTPLNPEQRDFAETISTSGEALLTIINDILDFSKIEAGRIELEAAPFSLRPCIEGALDVIAPQAARKGLELAYAIDPEVPSVVIGDSGRLRQVLLNLLSNAVKFTEHGEVVLRVTGHRLDQRRASRRGGHWEIEAEIRDTGLGIPADRIGRLFQSFSQADLSIARRFGGTGLGLAISRRLAELMNGSLVAQSEGIEGKGSLFRLVIRVEAASGLDVSPVQAGPLPELVGRRALVVDDNATNRQILVAQVARWGIACHDTPSSLEALAWIEAGETFDVALIDLVMPELDGYALADRIRASTGGAAVPVVILSSVGTRDRDAPSVSAFLTKPVKPSALHDALMTVLHAGDTAPSVRLSERPVADQDLATRHPLRILIAEDNLVNQKVARKLLSQLGYEADIAGNGLEAIEAAAAKTYDVILMDVQMPEMDGLEATRRIRAGEGPSRDVRIVAMTANALAGDREMCLAAGMDDYVSKPIRPAELAAALAATPSAPAATPSAGIAVRSIGSPGATDV